MPDVPGRLIEQPQVEQPTTPEESSVEADLETLKEMPAVEEPFLEEEEAPTTQVAVERQSSVSSHQSMVKDEVTVEVEKVLEEGLGNFYAQLPTTAKQKFKDKGEQASNEIAAMVRGLKLNFKRALRLIRDWLLTIPKVNRFFLEQEAKIKVDKLNELVESLKEDALNKP